MVPRDVIGKRVDVEGIGDTGLDERVPRFRLRIRPKGLDVGRRHGGARDDAHGAAIADKSCNARAATARAPERRTRQVGRSSRHTLRPEIEVEQNVLVRRPESYAGRSGRSRKPK